MKRRLILMRHAKSSWSTDAASDHARPLNARGREDAPRVAADLLERGWVPQHVLSSDATRTRETWARMADTLGDAPTTFTRGLYHAGIDSFEEEVGLMDDGLSCLLVLGHNPAFEEIAHWLTGQDVQLTTANAVLLEGNGTTWARSLRRKAWTLIDVVRPKEIP